MIENENKIVLRGSMLSIFSAGFVALVNYLIRRHLSLTLSVQEVGEFYAAISLVTMIGVFSELGLFQTGVTAFLNQKAKMYRVHPTLPQVTAELGERGYAVQGNPLDLFLEA